MNEINLVRPTLKPYLRWHWPRLSFPALFVIALLRVKTINLTELATGFCSKAQTDSSYKRLQRFFRHFDIETLFGMFKTKGFCLESTHFTDSERLSKLLALMSLALCWTIKMGEWLNQH